MQEPQDTVESALYGSAWDEPLPTIMYKDPDATFPTSVAADMVSEQERIKEQFKIDDQGKANWAIRRIREAMRRSIEVNKAANAELERIKAWRHKVETKESRERDFFEGLLRDYAHDALAHSDGQRRSIALSEGTLQFTKRQPKLIYDDKALIQELEDKDLEKLIRRKAEPNLVEIKQAIRGGVIIDAITVEEQADSFKVGVNE
ncbi:hypothetical protein LCGC14_0516860 [marine sediment metagenome]|uniref:Uncharacterized protein n=1 Tax=marine sediment metagenome TaxID=412755 RepID=A0A0F9SI11_9ZZZZ